MEETLKGIVRYDGTDFAGWQIQEHARTVQGEIEAALSRIADAPVRVQGASRTDAGVHALGQVFSCRWPGKAPDRLRHALSQMLKPEIRVVSLECVPDDFNARFSTVSKRYLYTFDCGPEPDPFAARYAWHVPYNLDLECIRALLPELEGRHDFAGLESTGSQMKTTERTLFEVRMAPGGAVTPCDADQLWHLSLHGDGFLYHMVRNIAGTLIEIGRGRWPASFLAECLTPPGPFRGHCAPAHGLALAAVYYE
jgi:tRNA pseudouridine38-40 synthase